ncbi:MAG: sigma-70 family RNA polymerase sigma factor [Chloroflexota bacterium]|nr:sigma-70 family RNA polymerase sigma factor [Chloroflexota bacterium]
MNGNPVTGHLADQQRADRRMIAALAAGDPNALETLYNEYATLVITVINRMVRDRQIAEELLQEVFLRIWQHVETYEPERGQVRSWILGVAHNLALNELRRQRRRPAILSSQPDTAGETGMPDDPITRLPDPGLQPDDIAWLRERRARLADALGQLPDVQRAVIGLYANGYSQSEIASRLDEPLGTVKTRMRRGLLRLRDIVHDLEPDRE